MLQPAGISQSVDYLKYEFVQRFLSIGIRNELISKWSEEALNFMEKEPEEEELLIKSIKNFSKEKKA